MFPKRSKDRELLNSLSPIQPLVSKYILIMSDLGEAIYIPLMKRISRDFESSLHGNEIGLYAPLVISILDVV